MLTRRKVGQTTVRFRCNICRRGLEDHQIRAEPIFQQSLSLRAPWRFNHPMSCILKNNPDERANLRFTNHC